MHFQGDSLIFLIFLKGGLLFRSTLTYVFAISFKRPDRTSGPVGNFKNANFDGKAMVG